MKQDVQRRQNKTIKRDIFQTFHVVVDFCIFYVLYIFLYEHTLWDSFLIIWSKIIWISYNFPNAACCTLYHSMLVIDENNSKIEIFTQSDINWIQNLHGY